MSGGVGPSSDISLPQEPEYNEPDALKPSTKNPVGPVNRSFFTFRQLNVLAMAVVLSASGMVSMEDVAFVLFSFVYLYFMSLVAFPPTSAAPQPPLFGDNTTVLLTLYTTAAAALGILLPVAYIFEGIFEGDKEGIKAAAPHVFLLASQVFMEGLASSGNFSLPIQVFVHVFYNSRRILTIVEWMTSEISKAEMEDGGNWRRLYVGRALAVANMAFWSFNLFGVILPVFLPKAFRTYYSQNINNSYRKFD